jgi:uncharacterized membrane protein YdcZ (DUF606 family)
LFIAPLFFWILINILIANYLKGAAFFIIPVFFGLLSLWILIRKERSGNRSENHPNLFLMPILATPAICLFAPHLQFFPVGLGLKMMVASTIFTVLLFGLLLPVFGFYKMKRPLAIFFFVLAIAFFVKAHITSDFTSKRQKPNSLVYYQDADKGESYWATYDEMRDDWTAGYLGENPEEASKYIGSASGSKYSSGYTYAVKAPQKNIPLFKTELKKDTIINGLKNVTFIIKPQRNVNQISLYSEEDINFTSLSFNGQSLPLNNDENSASQKIKSKELVRFYVSDNDSLEVSYSVAMDKKINFTVIEYSYDLLTHPQFSINKRAENMMPKPFVVTDAIAVKKKIDVNSLKFKVSDTLQ